LPNGVFPQVVVLLAEIRALPSDSIRGTPKATGACLHLGRILKANSTLEFNAAEQGSDRLTSSTVSVPDKFKQLLFAGRPSEQWRRQDKEDTNRHEKPEMFAHRTDSLVFMNEEPTTPLNIILHIFRGQAEARPRNNHISRQLLKLCDSANYHEIGQAFVDDGYPSNLLLWLLALVERI
jgi:hypothetical protein